MKNLTEKTISSKLIYEGGMVTLQVDQVELPNGKTSTRDIVKHQGSVGIAAFTDDNRILMVRQFRKALDRVILEIPAGKLEKGEDPKVCAARELEEETGYKAEKIDLISSFYTSPGYTNELKYLYKATNLIEGELNLDEDEFVELEKLTYEECLQAMKSGDICDVKTIFAIHLWEREREINEAHLC